MQNIWGYGFPLGLLELVPVRSFDALDQHVQSLELVDVTAEI